MPMTLIIAPNNFRRGRHVYLMTDDVVAPENLAHATHADALPCSDLRWKRQPAGSAGTDRPTLGGTLKIVTAKALEPRRSRTMNKRHTYSVRLDWTGNEGAGTVSYGAYSRSHELSAAGKQTTI